MGWCVFQGARTAHPQGEVEWRRPWVPLVVQYLAQGREGCPWKTKARGGRAVCLEMFGELSPGCAIPRNYCRLGWKRKVLHAPKLMYSAFICFIFYFFVSEVVRNFFAQTRVFFVEE